MIAQPVTINLPLSLYDRLKLRADESQTTIEDELLQLVAEAVPSTTELSAELDDELGQLVMLDDQALQRAASSHLSKEIAEQLELLHWRRQREGLSPSEESELENHVKQYERAMLVRAQAAAILKQRGIDVSQLDKAE
jgi:hypothetical protein